MNSKGPFHRSFQTVLAFMAALSLNLGSPSSGWAKESEEFKDGTPVLDNSVLEALDTSAVLTDAPLEIPPPAEAVEFPDHIEIKVGEAVYRVQDPALEEPSRAAYNLLSESEQRAFHNNRRLFLSMLARGLNLMKYGFGVGVIVKDKVQYSVRKMQLGRLVSVFRRAHAATPAQTIYEAPASLLADEATADVAREQEREERTRLTLRTKSNEVILGMIRAVDENLWLQAPLFANSNEFGLVAAGGVELLAAKKNKGWGGLVDIGISLGYNRNDQALVFQIFTDKESFKSSALPALFLAGLVFKSGMYVANQREGILDHHGTSFYPPLAPAFASITQDNFMTGVSSGLTWPPSPIGDMLTYLDKLDQNMLLRVTVSPIQKGYIRVQSSLASSSFRLIVEPVKAAFAYVTKIFKKWTCRDYLNPGE